MYLSVCMHICIYLYLCICMYIYIYVYVCTCTYISIYKFRVLSQRMLKNEIERVLNLNFTLEKTLY